MVMTRQIRRNKEHRNIVGNEKGLKEEFKKAELYMLSETNIKRRGVIKAENGHILLIILGC